jgi:hypothetical protein
MADESSIEWTDATWLRDRLQAHQPRLRQLPSRRRLQSLNTESASMGIHGKPKFRAEFNCWLICKQRVSGSNPLVG